MRVQAQVAISADQLKYSTVELFVKHDLTKLFVNECMKNIDITEHEGFEPGSKIYALDAFVIRQEDFVMIMEYLAAIDFLGYKSDKDCVAKIKELLRK